MQEILPVEIINKIRAGPPPSISMEMTNLLGKVHLTGILNQKTPAYPLFLLLKTFLFGNPFGNEGPPKNFCLHVVCIS